MKDYLAIAREFEEQKRLERERITAERAVLLAEENEYRWAWEAVYETCQNADRDDADISLSAFRSLAGVLRTRGYDVWLPAMIEIAANAIDDRDFYRPAHILVLDLLMFSSNEGIGPVDFAKRARTLQPAYPDPDWRQRGALQICEFIGVRAERDRAAKEELRAKEAEASRLARAEGLRQSVSNRPSIEKQLFAIYWKDKGLQTAQIRDKWNLRKPTEKVDPGTVGRRDIKTAIRRGREFLNNLNASVAEMAEALGIRVDS